MRRVMLLLTLLAAMGLSGAGTGVAAGATGPASLPGAFRAPVEVLGGMFYWGIDMGVDSTGHVHVVAAGMHAGKAGLWYATDRTGQWVAKRLLPWSAGAVYVHPSMAIDARDRIHIAMDRYACVECTVTVVKGIFSLSDVGRPRDTFPATPTRLTAAGTAQPSLRASGGHVFLAYAGNPDKAEQAVRLLTDVSGRWTTSTVVAQGSRPALRIGMDGKPRVVLTSGTTLVYARATTRTGGWIREPITFTTGIDGQPALSIDADGGAHVIWVDGHAGLRYGTRDPGGWIWTSLGMAPTAAALSVDKPAVPWIAVAAESLQAFRLVGGLFTPVLVDLNGAVDVRVKVLDAGKVVVAYFGGSDMGIWVSHT